MAANLFHHPLTLFHLLIFSQLSFLILIDAHYSPSSSSSSSAPVHFLRTLNGTQKGGQAQGPSELKKYLARLGYIDKTNPQTLIHTTDNFFDDMLESGVKMYQRFYNLEVTGSLDEETLELLQQPRCGVADLHLNSSITSSFLHDNSDSTRNDHDHVGRGSLYTFLGTVWPHSKRLLYFSYGQGARTDARLPVALAMGRWMTVTRFIFRFFENFNKADVRISFKRGNHADGFPFDGPGGVVAHSFPPTDGRLHFDSDESWTTSEVPENGKIDLQTVALHELGHVLGLGHSRDPKAVMYPYFDLGKRKDLGEDDLQAIKALYHDK